MSGYFGSKAASGLCQNIIAMMPPHETYIETHLGGGAIMKRKPPAVKNIGIDIDPEPLSQFDCAYPVHLVNDCAHHFLTHHPYSGTELIYGRISDFCTFCLTLLNRSVRFEPDERKRT